MDWDQKYSVSDGVIYESLDGSIVILNIQTEYYHTLNDVGSRMWELLIAGCNGAEAIDTLLNEFDVPEAMLRADMEQFVAKLCDADLLAAS